MKDLLNVQDYLFAVQDVGDSRDREGVFGVILKGVLLLHLSAEHFEGGRLLRVLLKNPSAVHAA